MEKTRKLMWVTIMSILVCLVACAVLSTVCGIKNGSAYAQGETYEHTYVLGANGETDDAMTTAWNTAVGRSGKVLVKLNKDWNTTGYLTVPQDADITLDLNGHVIDRGLTSAESLGYVIYNLGSLTVIDSDPSATHSGGGYTYEEGTAGDKPYLTQTVQKTLTGGIITGGYSSDSTAGIHSDGNLTLNGGTIYGNTTTFMYGGGIYVGNGKTFTMNGGAVIGNKVSYVGHSALGGGIAVRGGAKFTMNGGLIADNVVQNESTTSDKVYGDAFGGGVLIFGTSTVPVEFVMTGGKINNNRTIAAEISGAISAGGAICLQYAIAEITDDPNTDDITEISDNRTLQVKNGVEGFYDYWSYGGAIASYNKNNGQAGVDKELTFSGGIITRNAAYYGAICMYGDQDYTGGEIVNNVAYGYFAGIRFNQQNSTISISKQITYYDNYVLSAENEIMYDGSYEIPYDDAQANNDPQIDSHDFYLGALDDGVRRSLMVYDWVLDRNVGLSLGYIENNSESYIINNTEYKIPINPNKYFESGRPESAITTVLGKLGIGGKGKIVLNSEGEVAVASSGKNIVFTVEYDDDTSDEFDYDSCDYYGTTVAYSDKTIKSIKFNNEVIYPAQDVATIDGVGMYEFKGRIGTDAEKGENNTKFTEISELFTIFRVVVLPKEITGEDADFVAEFDDVEFTGVALTPVPKTVTYKGVALEKGVDYTISYSNNVDAGENAEAVFTFTGNYCGTVTEKFTILQSSVENYEVVWQYLVDGNWTENAPSFVYDGTDQSGKIRAALTLDPEAENVSYTYIYAKGLEAQNTTSAYLQISGTFDGQSVDRLLNAAEYTVEIVGGNYDLSAEETVTIAAQEIDFTELDYKDESNVRLWRLVFGESTYSELRDSVTYVVDGEAVVGTETDAYARFRNTLLNIELNPNYKLNGKALSAYLEVANVAYTNASATGAENTVTDITTKVTLVFDANYSVSGATNNTVTIEKSWHIVTINNGLLNADGSAATLPAFTYGVATDIAPFRAEHGNTVFFAFRNGTTVLLRIAVVYGDNGKAVYYESRISNDRYIIDDEIPDDKYFATVINHLAAGNYQLDVHVNEFTDSDSVVYYAIDRTFDLTVNAYALESGDDRITVAVETPELVYSGSAVAPTVTVTFDEIELVYGKDYTVSTSSVDFGPAVATVKGLGNFGGSIEVGFSIAQAENEWIATPNIIRWVYSGFASSVNIVTSNPRYMDARASVAYTVLDSDKNPIAALTNFHTDDNGVVTATVAAELAKLGRGTYYLIAHLDGTNNYTELDTSDSPLEFNVIQATNVWLENPSIIQWHFGEFVKENNRIYAVAKFLDDNAAVLYSIATDAAGTNIYSNALKDFTAVGGVVTGAIADELNKLPVGRYYLVAKVGGTANYTALEFDSAIPFDVEKAANAWADGEGDLVLPSWVVGNYNEAENPMIVNAAHGTVNIIVTDIDGNEYFNSVTGVNNLNDCEVGKYLLKAWVDETTDFAALAERTFTIEVLDKVGLPWWGTLVIVLAVLIVVALIIFILWKKGVFQILTGKLVLAIRTRATIDATIASVRASKVAARARETVAQAEALDEAEARAEARRKALEDAKSKPLAERAAELEEKARETTERADRMKSRADRMQERVQKMKQRVQQERETEAEANEATEVDSDTDAE